MQSSSCSLTSLSLRRTLVVAGVFWGVGTSLYHAARSPVHSMFVANIPISAGHGDIRSSQETVLQVIGGQIEKVRLGSKVFLDGDEVLGSLAEEMLGRSFIRSNKAGVKARCERTGYVYAVTASKGPQEAVLVERGFQPLDYPEFEVFSGSKAVAYQKRVEVGEALEFGNWVLLIFGPEERGGVSYARMRSLVPPAFLPDGSEFKTWEVPLKFSKTYYVEQRDARASDGNPGTKDLPFKTINRAAEVLQAGERVVVGEGVYREWVRPERGGTDPEHMISYEAAPGAKVVIRGSELLKVKWVKSIPWIEDKRTTQRESTVKEVWMARLPGDLFHGYNPFAISNFRQVNQMIHWNVSEVFSYPRSKVYLNVRGLIFQDGRRLEQVTRYTDLFTNEGTFWVETNGLTIHVSPYEGKDPNQAEWELTTREQIFAPESYHLGYVRVKGFTMEHAGNGFPFPQRGAISTMHGHHWLIEDNTLQWINAVGIDIGDQGEPPSRRPEILGYHILRRNTLNDIGIAGITGPKPHGSLIEYNVFRRNAWHDVEYLAECAAIKTHTNLNFLVRGNLIFDTLHGSGIWIDASNSNSRITQNVVVNTGSNNGPGPGLGAIFVEKALASNWVDHNFVWGSTQTNGIFEYTASKIVIAYNMIGNCAGAGILLLDTPEKNGQPTVPASKSTNNRVLNNILINNGWNIGFQSVQNVSDHNVLSTARQPKPFHFLDKEIPRKASFEPWPLPFRGFELASWRSDYGLDTHSSTVDMTAKFDPDTLRLEWAARGEVIDGVPIENMVHDFWNRPQDGPRVLPGPFGSTPRTRSSIVVDPRLSGDQIPLR